MKSVCKGMILVGLFGVLEVGCVAQQADVARIQKDLEQQIGQLKSEKIALGQQIEEAHSAIAKSQSMIAAQKADMKKMRSDFAPLNQQIKLLREQDLTSLYGKIEVSDKKVSDLRSDLEAHENNFTATTGTIQATVHSHGEQLQATQAQSTALAQQVDENNQGITKQLTDFQTAFGEFKRALTDIGTELTTETQRASSAEAELSTQQQDFQVRSDELAQAILQLQDTVKQSGTLLGTQLDGQIVEQALHQTEFQQQVDSLQNKLNTDIQALRTFLEQDVKVAMAQLATDMDDRQRPVVQNVDALQSDMEALGLHVQADATQMQELSQSVVQLREAQGVMGSLLGKRGDSIIQQSGRLSERMNTIESHQSTLTDQLQSNTQKTLTHLTEVNARLTSNSKRLDQTTQSFSQRITQQEKTVATLNQGIRQLQELQGTIEGQIQQTQAANQFTDQLRESIEQINSRLQDLEIHQSGLVGKLDSDVQATTTHLQEVTNGIQSVAQALESVSAKLNKRIANQEQQLNRAMTTFQSVHGAADVAQANVQHLNDLTGTISQLQEVINTIGIKLGERVDEHEDRLGQLAQRVNHLGSKRKK